MARINSRIPANTIQPIQHVKPLLADAGARRRKGKQP